MAKFQPKKLLREWFGMSEPLNKPDFDLVPRLNPDGRADWCVQRLISDSHQASRENPLARRILSLTSQYVIGKGIRFECADPNAQAYLTQFWEHPLNQMGLRVSEWCEELARSGNLFILFSSDPAGMCYVRAIPAQLIQEIHTQPNDAEQLKEFELKPDFQLRPECVRPFSGNVIPAVSWTSRCDEPAILHFAVNRPLGALWGEPDLSPLLKWISRYSNWLEDRARLNRYRNSFLFVVRTRLINEAQRLQRQRQLNAIPPEPGSILVTGDQEEWSVLSPRLESNEANQDGLALKKMIAAGAGIPLHFLAEPESENKASAESAGESTWRHFEQRQRVFLKLIELVLRQALFRSAQFHLPSDTRNCTIQVFGDDISKKDNLNLSAASLNIIRGMKELYELNLIDSSEFRRILYKFLGENLPEST